MRAIMRRKYGQVMKYLLRPSHGEFEATCSSLSIRESPLTAVRARGTNGILHRSTRLCDRPSASPGFHYLFWGRPIGVATVGTLLVFQKTKGSARALARFGRVCLTVSHVSQRSNVAVFHAPNVLPNALAPIPV